MSIAPGTLLGRYRVISQLGKGGMGEVYKAFDPSLERTVALKVLPAALVSDPQRLMRFAREAKSASALNHPNIITIYEVDRATLDAAPPGSCAPATVHYIAMEYVEGVTLRDKMHAERAPLGELLGHLAQAADGLAKAHATGIVHRDLKPENIMITSDGYTKVLDFGLAKLDEPRQEPGEEGLSQADTAVMPQRSGPGMVLGTFGYMSPEQAQSLPVDQRSDVFSFGCILYEAATGRRPFHGDTVIKSLHQVVYEEPSPVAELNPRAPGELQRIIRRCLAKHPDERYQSIREVGAELRELLREAGALDGVWHAAPSAYAETTLEGRAARPTAGGAAATTAGEVTNAGDSAAAAVTTPRRGTRARLYGLAALAAAALVALALYLGYARAGTQVDSIAILPFVNAGADPEAEYLSDGITESIINSLSQLPEVAVISRSSAFRYKGREVDPQQVGRELKVQALLLGRVAQRGDQLLISVELVDAATRRQVWGEQYSRRSSDILALQSDIAGEISEKLRTRLTGEDERRVTKHYTEDVEAYRLYLKGRFHWNKRTGEDLRVSVRYFEQAIARDPTYALAYAGLADCYVVLPVYSDTPPRESYPKALAAAARALELDETLAEAHTSLGALRIDHEWKFEEGERELRRAIELNPNYATAHHWYAQFLSGMGRHEEALARIRKAQELDPLSLIIDVTVGDTHLKARRYDEAIAHLRRTVEEDRNFSAAHSRLAIAYEEKGLFAEAAAEFQAAEVLNGNDAAEAERRAAALKEAAASGGARGYWRRRLELMQEEAARGGHVSPFDVAGAYARLGDDGRAVEWLQKSFDEHDPFIIYLKIAPQFDALRSDPRVLELMRKVGLPL
jgi:serine/threonine-protein kinase